MPLVLVALISFKAAFMVHAPQLYVERAFYFSEEMYIVEVIKY